MRKPMRRVFWIIVVLLIVLAIAFAWNHSLHLYAKKETEAHNPYTTSKVNNEQSR